jgi:N-methylhydantoinase A
MASQPLRLGVDVGGTFTDLVAAGADGTFEIRKVLSTPDDPATAVFGAVDRLSRSHGIASLILGTTIATNALLERRGARVILVTTAGFEDLLWLRRQDRAALYDLSCDHPPPLPQRGDVVGAGERMGPQGVVVPLAGDEIERVVEAIRERRPESIAVALLFAHLHAGHERALAEALRRVFPGVPVVCSHDVLPVFREYERFSTTTAEAYLRPLVSGHLGAAAEQARARGIAEFRVLTSGGGSLSVEAAGRSAAALALSGPAGGVVGARIVGEAVGYRDLLTLDMGGTSADASLVQQGEARREGATIVGGIPLALPAVLIETVSAGGGSVAWVDAAGTLKVGPRSARARPGPACFGRGGTEPTVTDACLALGWLDQAWSLADDVRLDPGAAERALQSLAQQLGMDVRGVASGVVEVATAVMARALKRVSVARGVDPRRLALIPFGGAGPLFGCALADLLGMRTVIVPSHPGVLSALGIVAAPERAELVASLPAPAVPDRRLLLAQYADLERRAERTLPGGAIRRYADARFAGQGYEITVPLTNGELDGLEADFRAAHRSRYGHEGAGGTMEVVSVRVVIERAAPRWAPARRSGMGRPTTGRRRVTIRGATVDAQVWPLGELPARLRIEGPAILAGPDATALIEPGWRGVVDVSGAIVVERA